MQGEGRGGRISRGEGGGGGVGCYAKLKGISRAGRRPGGRLRGAVRGLGGLDVIG